jgi:hypothetical protein
MLSNFNTTKIMNGLFPREELAIERWVVLCNIAKDICKERNISESSYYPNQHSLDINEKTVGIALSNYRQGLVEKGTTCSYECVNYLIKQNGFEHWLVFKTDEEKSFLKWTKRIEYAQERSIELHIPFELFYPCQRSDCKQERELAVAINNYQQALHEKGTHRLYESVTMLLREKSSHWLTISTKIKIALEKWRKKWETIKYICEQKKIAYTDFYRELIPNHPVEKTILQAIRQYQRKTQYNEIDLFIRLFHPFFTFTS